MLREKLIDDDSLKYFVGHDISAMLYPLLAIWASISLSNTKSVEYY